MHRDKFPCKVIIPKALLKFNFRASECQRLIQIITYDKRNVITKNDR